MGKYESLAERLDSMAVDQWSATFAEIEDILQFRLPPSARRHRSWWGNSRKGNHSQAKGWVPVGWEVDDVDLKAERVLLRRAPDRGETVSRDDSGIEALWNEARRMSGVDDRTDLERLVLQEFLYNRAVKNLIALGGTMPDFEAAPRRRFD